MTTDGQENAPGKLNLAGVNDARKECRMIDARKYGPALIVVPAILLGIVVPILWSAANSKPAAVQAAEYKPPAPATVSATERWKWFDPIDVMIQSSQGERGLERQYSELTRAYKQLERAIDQAKSSLIIFAGGFRVDVGAFETDIRLPPPTRLLNHIKMACNRGVKVFAITDNVQFEVLLEDVGAVVTHGSGSNGAVPYITLTVDEEAVIQQFIVNMPTVCGVKAKCHVDPEYVRAWLLPAKGQER
jgi:hypothetical protein